MALSENDPDDRMPMLLLFAASPPDRVDRWADSAVLSLFEKLAGTAGQLSYVDSWNNGRFVCFCLRSLWRGRLEGTAAGRSINPARIRCVS